MSVTDFPELPWMWGGLAFYMAATVMAFRGVMMMENVGTLSAPSRINQQVVLACIVIGVVLLTLSLGVRWDRLGHGPFVNLFELLISQLFSLGLIYAIVYWRVPAMRASAVVVMPLIWILGTWVLLIEPADSRFPPTYSHNWLWAHVGFGKVFLSFLLVAAGLAGIILTKSLPVARDWFRGMSTELLDQMAWRFMILVLVFDSLMLIAGAVWAQDAWGRYWAWDALETSSFMTWLSIGAAIHVRMTYKLHPQIGALTILAIFGLAFVTYFGAPFYSQAAHKGVI